MTDFTKEELGRSVEGRRNFSTTGALKNYKCSRCNKDKSCVIKVNDKLVCVQCRFDEIGKDAFYECLYSGFD